MVLRTQWWACQTSCMCRISLAPGVIGSFQYSIWHLLKLLVQLLLNLYARHCKHHYSRTNLDSWAKKLGVPRLYSRCMVYIQQCIFVLWIYDENNKYLVSVHTSRRWILLLTFCTSLSLPQQYSTYYRYRYSEEYMTSISCSHSRITPVLSSTILLGLRQATRSNCGKSCPL